MAKRFIKTVSVLCAASLMLSGCVSKTAENTNETKKGSVELISKADSIDIPKEPRLEDFYEDGEITDSSWEQYRQMNDLYRNAIERLKSEKPDKKYLKSLHGFTADTVKFILQNQKENQNKVYSPANFYMAMTLLAESTDGETQRQILDLLGVFDTQKMLEQTNLIWRNLYNNTQTGTTKPANSLWIDSGFSVNQDTIDTLSKYCYNSTYQAQMGDEQTDKAIADWINENTGNLLKDKTAEINTEGIAAMFCSTLYFYDEWKTAFDENETQDETFTRQDGSRQKTQFMHKTELGNFVSGENFTAANMDFAGGNTMYFVLPNESTDINELLSQNDAIDLITRKKPKKSGSEHGNVIWSVPKFDISAEEDMKNCLTALGVTDVFDMSKADMTPLSSDRVYVDKISHNARVKIDEKGCEAAAYTQTQMKMTSLPPEEIPTYEMNLNRPFLFVITGENNLPLFIGTVNDAG